MVVFAGILTIQIPRVQTFIAQKVVKGVSDKIDGDIRFEKIHLKPFTTLVLKNVAIIDRYPVADPADPAKAPTDTFFRAEYIIARFTLDGLLKSEGFRISRAFISNAQMNLVLEDREDDGSGNTTGENLTRIFRIPKKQVKKVNPKEIFRIQEVEIDNLGFALINHKVKKTPRSGMIDWNDMSVSGISLSARDLRFKGGVMSGDLERMTFREKSGFNCHSITGSAEVGNGKTIIRNLKIKDDFSDIDMPLYMMSYSCAKDFGDYISKVKMDAEIKESILDFRTLAFFANALKGNDLRLSVSGSASGYVDDFMFRNIKTRSAAGGFSGLVDGRITGLPEIESTWFDGRIRNFNLTTDGIGRFVSVWMKEGKLDLSRFAKGYIFNLKGSARGFLNDMKIYADLSSMIGKAKADIRMGDVISDNPIALSGVLRTEDLDLGRIIGTDLIGPATLRTGLDARLGKGAPQVELDSLIVDRLMLNGYDYSGIAAAGKLEERSFDGKLICNDPNLNFLFQGTFALSSKTKNSRYQFYANVGHADLHKLNLDKRGTSKVQFQTNANFTRTGQGDLLGKIDVGHIVLENNEGKHKIGNVNLTSHTNDDKWGIRLKSEFADGSFNGSASIGQFISDLRQLTLQKEIPALFKTPAKEWEGNTYALHFRFHDSMDLMSFALPGCYIADSTSLDLNISKEGKLKMLMKSPRIAYKRQYLKNVTAKADNSNDALNGEITAKEISIASMILSDNRIQILADENNLGAGYSYDNHGELENRGEFVIRSRFDRTDDKLAADIDVLPTTLHLNSRMWNIQPSHIVVLGSEIDVESLEFTSSEQRIHIEGKTSATDSEILTLNLDRFDISIINSLIGADMGIAGAATGKVQVTSPLKDFGLIADMICDSTYIAGIPLGELKVGSRWDEDFERFDITLANALDSKQNIKASGKLSPKLKTLEAVAELDSLRIGYVQPFVKEIFSELDGTVSGKVMVDGPLNKLEISSSDTRIEDAVLKIAYTNVPYYAHGDFHIDSRGAYLDNISVRDDVTGTGTMGGKIYWDHFRNIGFDLTGKVTDMECINLTEKQGDYFYGKVYATGNISITGPMNSIQMDIDAVTSKAGELHIPITSAMASGGGTNLLKFKEPEKTVYIDPYEAMMSKIEKKEKTSGDFGVRLRVAATQDVEAFVEIDKASGNVLSGRGNGTIDLEVSSDVFDINGDYNITGGNYKFVVLGLASRDFNILDGSSIRFRGDIMESDLDINATYRTKASLSTLISDTTSVANKRPVDCGISISDKLSNPRLAFSITIPDLDPMIKSRVESALSTEDKVQKQFLSLIVSNNFLPDEQSGIVDNSSMLYSNVSEILANQLNNIFQKLNIPLDLGLNYQPNERGNDIFDVAVSTQLFNNRVVVNGNIGNRQYSSSSKNNVVGDIDIEIKLDRSGALRLNLFSHSADQYTNFLDNSQRNGVGLTYQTEFNSFGKFFKNMFSSKAKRKEAKRLEEEAMINEGKVVIDIEKSDRKNTSAKEKRQKKKYDRKRKTVSDSLSVGGK